MRGYAWNATEESVKAIADFTKALLLDPQNARACHGRGVAWLVRGKYDRAIADFTAAIRRMPQYHMSYPVRGDAWRGKKVYDKAITDYNEAIRLDPNNAYAYFNRGLAWYGKDDYDKAIADFSETFRLDPQDRDAYHNRGIVWAAKREYDEAIADFTAAVQIDPQFARAHFYRGFAWNVKKEHDKAIADYGEAIRLDPRDAQAYLGRAAAWRAKGEEDKAASDENDAACTRIKYATDEENRRHAQNWAASQPEYFVAESDGGLLVDGSEYGEHLVFWHSQKVAERMCGVYARGGPLPLRVSEMDTLEFHNELIACRDTGMQYILMDHTPDGDHRIVPISDLIDLVGERLTNDESVNAATRSPNARRSQTDEYVRMLDEQRQLGIVPDKEHEYLPIDCPECGGLFYVDEVEYRQWRDGEEPDMVCTHCLSVFQEAHFGTVTCMTCGAESGTMPGSLCRQFFEPENRWRCPECWARDANGELHSEIEQTTRPSAKADPAGWLVLVALTGGLGLLIAWTC